MSVRKMIIGLGLTAAALGSATVLADESAKKGQKDFAIAPIVSSSPSFGTGGGVTTSYLYDIGEGNRRSQLMGAAQYFDTDSYNAFLRNMAFWDGGKKRAITAAGIINVRNDFDGAKFDTQTFGLFHRQLWQVADNWFAGVHASAVFSSYSARNAMGQGFLDMTGATDNDVYGVGVNVSYDSRDNFYYPMTGALFEVNTFSYLDALGSDEDYDVYEVKYSKYFTAREDDVVALGFYGRYVSDGAPYSGESYLGRRSYLRGFNAGEVSGTDLTGIQAEYRYHINEKWKAVAFAGLANMQGGNAEANDNEGNYYSAGVGVRYAIQPQDKVHLRFDVAFGNDDNQGFYIGLQEAF